MANRTNLAALGISAALTILVGVQVMDAQASALAQNPQPELVGPPGIPIFQALGPVLLVTMLFVIGRVLVTGAYPYRRNG